LFELIEEVDLICFDLIAIAFPLSEISLGLLEGLQHPAGWSISGAGSGSLMLVGLGLIGVGLFSRIGRLALLRLLQRRARSL
jgi:hypothetical protein